MSMQLAPVKFGTDGWRGVIARDFTFQNVRRVAQATADYWRDTSAGPRETIVGYDNRFLSETFARLVAEVLAANGLKVCFPPAVTPTPAVSYAVRDRRLCGAVMITASHNPPEFNGYKIKADYAGSAEPELCAQVEARLDRSPVRSLDFAEALKQGAIEQYDPCPAHLAAVERLADLRVIRRANLRVVFDSIHGCGGRLLEQRIAGTSHRAGQMIQTIRADRQPLFGGVNPEPIAKNLGELCAAVRRTRARVGLATDGDADRLGVVDNRGRYVSIQLVFALLLVHLIRHRPGPATGLVVKTGNCTVLIDRICRAHGLELAEVPVGFKYVCAKMRETDVLIGGEESGGIGFRGHIPERDGILASLILLELLAVTGKSMTELLADLQKEFGRSVYDRIDMHYPLEKRETLLAVLRDRPPDNLLGSPLAAIKTYDGVKYVARDDSWLMFRASGTEPIVRIYSEARSAARVRRLLHYGRGRALQCAGI